MLVTITLEGLASWKDGKLSHYPGFAGQDALTLLEDREGTVWVGGGGPTKKLCAIHGGSVQCYGEDGGFGRGVTGLYEDAAGSLWAGAATGLWRWKPGLPKLFSSSDPDPFVFELTEGDNRALLIAMNNEIRQLVNGKAEAYPLPGTTQQFKPRWLLRDRNGGLWIGTNGQGLLHVHQGKTDVFARSDGLSGDFVQSIFQDREGSVWVATLDGLDASATSPSPLSLSTKVCPTGSFGLFWWPEMAAFGLARRMAWTDGMTGR